MNLMTSLSTLAFAGCAFALAACDRDDTREPVESTAERMERETEAAPAAPESPQAIERTRGMEQQGETAERPQAVAELQAAEGAEIEGKAKFYETPRGVRVVVDVEEGPPGKKGLHIHEKGDCSNIKGKSMGGHFAPEGDKHALPSEAGQGERHLGDLGNIDLGKDGKAHMEITVSGANLKPGDKLSYLGKAIVVHTGQDMGKSKQPSGDSGTPIACGVIEEE